MAISVGDEFETYESVKCKIEEIPLIQIVNNLVSNFNVVSNSSPIENCHVYYEYVTISGFLPCAVLLIARYCLNYAGWSCV